jgi:hypothetical protein
MSPGVKLAMMKSGFTFGTSCSVLSTIWSNAYPLTPAFTTFRPIRSCR